jgi:hypothetical protein
MEQIGKALPARARSSSRYARGQDDRGQDDQQQDAPSSEVRPAVRTRRGAAYRIIEAIEDGAETWIVTNGTDRAVCNSRALAKRVAVSLGR